MNVEISDSGTSITENEINEFEKTYDVSIPPEYFTFLLENNGGRPKPSDFLIPGKEGEESEWVSIARFLGIGVSQTNSLEYVLRVFKYRLPSDIFPIARDPGGNLICISTNPHNLGKILFWDHEFESDSDEEPTYNNVYYIADSFDEFLSALTE